MEFTQSYFYGVDSFFLSHGGLFQFEGYKIIVVMLSLLIHLELSHALEMGLFSAEIGWYQAMAILQAKQF